MTRVRYSNTTLKQMDLSVFLQRGTSMEDDKIRKPPWKQED